jgi:hypothetical protein
MAWDAPDTDLLVLPTHYNGWTLLDAHYDGEWATFTYQRTVSGRRFRVFVERDGPVWAGALLDWTRPVSVHGEPLATFEVDSFAAMLTETKRLLDRDGSDIAD